MSTATETEPELAMHCEVAWCGQPLLIRAPGRTRCERCRLGRTPKPADPSEQTTEVKEEASPVSCAHCGETDVPGHPGLKLSIAEGFCLGCRVQGFHLG